MHVSLNELDCILYHEVGGSRSHAAMIDRTLTEETGAALNLSAHDSGKRPGRTGGEVHQQVQGVIAKM